MSRRDTIIIAVLVNAGLLMILFATALKSDNKKDDNQVSFTQLAQAPVTQTPTEEIVNHYAMAGVPTLEKQEVVEQPIVAPAKVAPVKPAPAKVAETKVTPPATTDVYLVNVTVKKGDFLERIAKANNTSVSSIMAENKLSSTQLRVGQVLRVPVHQKPLDVPAAIPSATEYYVVKDGDNPWLIASKNHVSVSELLRLNDLDEQKARRLRPGDKLKIR